MGGPDAADVRRSRCMRPGVYVLVHAEGSRIPKHHGYHQHAALSLAMSRGSSHHSLLTLRKAYTMPVRHCQHDGLGKQVAGLVLRDNRLSRRGLGENLKSLSLPLLSCWLSWQYCGRVLPLDPFHILRVTFTSSGMPHS